jgi:transcriptional regulator with XRE-family HTH domain
MIGKYEREEAVPSIEAAKKIAEAFVISHDYLASEGNNDQFDKKTIAHARH